MFRASTGTPSFIDCWQKQKVKTRGGVFSIFLLNHKKNNETPYTFQAIFNVIPKSGAKHSNVINKKGGGYFYSLKFQCGHLPPPPRGLSPYPFINHFWQRRYPFRLPSPDKRWLFHIPSLEPCIPFSHRKSTVSFSRTNKQLNQENLRP